ncbi:TraU protein [uncultured archaeon]|nr:TraU protein [uncultured archaeon]
MKKFFAAFLSLFIALLAGNACAEDSFDLFNFLSLLDLEQCLLRSYRCEPLGCSVIPPMDRVCHNFPAGFVETHTAPFTTVVPMVDVVLSAISSSASQWAGSGGSSSGGSDVHLKYFEAHVFNMPTRTFIHFKYPFLKLCYYGSTPWEVNYLSEADTVSWRTGATDFLSYQFLLGSLAQISQVCTLTSIGNNTGDAIGENISVGGQVLGDVCMGTWGVTYPRTGYSNANSEPVASGIAAYRASRVVASPFLRVVFMPKLFDPNPKMQMGYPFFGKPLNCFSRGTAPLFWDNLDTKLPRGAGYIWVLWERTCCCFPSTGCLGLPPFI